VFANVSVRARISFFFDEIQQSHQPVFLACAVSTVLWNSKIDSLRIAEGRTRPRQLRTCPAGAGLGAMKPSLRNPPRQTRVGRFYFVADIVNFVPPRRAQEKPRTRRGFQINFS
jgi:hypothetical protein